MNPVAAIAEPNRAEILRLLWHGERSAGAIAAAMPVTFGAVSQHLRVLLETGLVSVRREGRSRIYASNRLALEPFASVLERMWSDKLGELKRLAEAEQRRIDAANATRQSSSARARHSGSSTTTSKRRSQPPPTSANRRAKP